MNHVIVAIEMLFFFGGIIAFGLWQMRAMDKRIQARKEGRLPDEGARRRRQPVEIPRERLGVFGSTYAERQARAVSLEERRAAREAQRDAARAAAQGIRVTRAADAAEAPSASRR